MTNGSFGQRTPQWGIFAGRIEQVLLSQGHLFSMELDEDMESQAQRYAAQIIAQRAQGVNPTGKFDALELDSMELVRARSVGVEALALHAIQQLGLADMLKSLKFNRHQLAAAVGSIVARMAAPGSELASHDWLRRCSALGELMGYDFEGMGLERLYRASDQLYGHKTQLEALLYERQRSVFGFDETLVLYDLTNTFFEGQGKANPKARHGHSKDKRTDCPLVTLGVVINGGGFIRHSELFAGNVTEAQTLEQMVCALNAQPGSIVILDAGIATQANITWLMEHEYRYLVVSRRRYREFDESKAVLVKQTADQQVRIQRMVTDSGEIQLRCYSKMRELKEKAITDRVTERFEIALKNLADGLAKKGTIKRHDKIIERVGRLKEKYSKAAPHYDIDVIADHESKNASAIHFKRNEKTNTQASHPGVYCLRTNLVDWDEAQLWHTYILLTDMEAVFRSLKSELGMRPIYHHKEKRIDGHIFITLLAYHFVHTLRVQLKAKGIHDSWQSIRRKMQSQQRVSASFRCEDGRTVHLRSSTRAEAHQQPIYAALNIPSKPGTTQKTFV